MISLTTSNWYFFEQMKLYMHQNNKETTPHYQPGTLLVSNNSFEDVILILSISI